jgi:hypothetical protein
MTEQDILKLAYESGIEVRIAKKEADAQAVGLHLVEPNIEQLLEGIKSALLLGVDMVVIHSKLGWPYQRDSSPRRGP